MARLLVSLDTFTNGMLNGLPPMGSDRENNQSLSTVPAAINGTKRAVVKHQHLSEPLTIRSVTLRNRVVSPPMERNYCDLDGTVTDRYVAYLESRARGGTALLFTEASYVRIDGRGREREMGVHGDHIIPGLRRLADAVHAHGALIGVELNHGGALPSRLSPAISLLHLRQSLAKPPATRCPENSRRKTSSTSSVASPKGAPMPVGRRRYPLDPRSPRVPHPPVSVPADEHAPRQVWGPGLFRQ